MPKLTKRRRAMREKLQAGKLYPVAEAFTLLKSMPPAKFREGVDVCVILGIDPRKSDQAVRGAIVLPKGTGREIRVAVFTTPAHAANAAKKLERILLALKI